MNDSDQSTAAAQGPHHLDGDKPESVQKSAPSIFARLRGFLTNQSENLRSDLQQALVTTESEEDAQFTHGERVMLGNVLKLSEMRVEDVMVPRIDIDAVEEDDTLGEVLYTLSDVGHSRLPVYQDNLDDIIGMVHIKDLVARMTVPVDSENGPSAKLQSSVLRQKTKTQDFLRPVLFVPPSMPVSVLLQNMQATRNHMAIVVDEYGGTDGLVTIEDLIETVVGDIEDEHDDAETAQVLQESEHVWQANARVSLEELQDTIGSDFDPGEYAEEADTLGGLVFSLIDRVPVTGEVVTKLKGFDFEVLLADPRRVKRVRIRRRVRGIRVRPKLKADPAAADAPIKKSAAE